MGSDRWAAAPQPCRDPHFLVLSAALGLYLHTDYGQVLEELTETLNRTPWPRPLAMRREDWERLEKRWGLEVDAALLTRSWCH